MFKDLWAVSRYFYVTLLCNVQICHEDWCWCPNITVCCDIRARRVGVLCQFLKMQVSDLSQAQWCSTLRNATPTLASHPTKPVCLMEIIRKICSNMFRQLPSVKHNNKLSYLVRNINLFSFLHTDFKVLLFWHSSKANKHWPLRIRIETQRCYFAVCRPQTHFSADKWSSLWGTLAGCDLREGR